MSTKSHSFYSSDIEIYSDCAEHRYEGSKWLGDDTFIIGSETRKYSLVETDNEYQLFANPETKAFRMLEGKPIVVSKTDVVEFENDNDGLVIVVKGGTESEKQFRGMDLDDYKFK